MAADFDVAIIGGGIGGGALATVLARDGLSVLVLEKSTVYRDHVRGEWLAPWGVATMVRSRQHSDAARRGDDARRTGWAIAATWGVALCIYGRFQHWGGDGSWGPRYLVPVLPLAAIAGSPEKPST